MTRLPVQRIELTTLASPADLARMGVSIPAPRREMQVPVVQPPQWQRLLAPVGRHARRWRP